MKIITLSGKAESGKDYSAKLLKEKLENLNYKVLIMHYGDLVKYTAKQFFNWDGLKDEYGRSLLQRWGTDIVRTKNPDYWAKFIIDMVEFLADEFDYILIPDCRFINEIELWKIDGWNISTLHIERLNHENKLTPEQRYHISETALDNYKFDYYIKCVSGIEYLDAEVDKFVKYLLEE